MSKQRRINLNLALDQFPEPVNQKQLFDRFDSGTPDGYLAITRDNQGALWMENCVDLLAAEKHFINNFLAENDEGRARLPLALVNLDDGTITYDIHVSISVEGRPEPLGEAQSYLTA